MSYEQRLESLREELRQRNLDGFIIPLTDEHMSEYVGAYAQRLAWLTGFKGSSGTAVVLPTKAAIFVDTRYVLQVRQQVDGRHWSYESVLKTSVAKWLAAHAPQGAKIGYDPWLHTKKWVDAQAELLPRGAELVAVATNPVDAVWTDRPGPSDAKLAVHPESVAGRPSHEKIRHIAEWLASNAADAVVLSALDSIAWTFNIRGQDIVHTPVALSFAVIHADAGADLFVAPEKLTDSVIAHLGSRVRRHPRDRFADYLSTLAGKTVAVDPAVTVAAITQILEAGGARVVEARDPVALPKAIKNAVEIAGQRAAHVRDGTALTQFLHWLSIEGPKGTVTEFSAAQRLREFREATGHLRDLSFDTISASGPSGAAIHYRASEENCRSLSPGTLYLVDSGGQYLDGTTDVTRAVAIGSPSAQMRDHFTRVLKGHIALATAVFPVGTRGGQLDALARQHLWAVGLDYGHGTSHGVGSYLGVHEGPPRIGRPHPLLDSPDEPLAPGMILSNEPGYYRENHYGIRIENLMVVVQREIDGAESEMLGFETLTLAPLDRTLIAVELLTAEEQLWIDAYHREVAQTIGANLDGEAKRWLMDVTRPLSEGAS